jgi:chaperonin cofactor prefoldin
MANECNTLSGAAIDRQAEVEEHDLVMRNLERHDGSRRCHHLVGDVLVESTVAEVLPTLKKNKDNLARVRGGAAGRAFF